VQLPKAWVKPPEQNEKNKENMNEIQKDIQKMEEAY